MALNGSFMSINSFPNGVDRSIGSGQRGTSTDPPGISLPAAPRHRVPLRSWTGTKTKQRCQSQLPRVYTNAAACTNRSLVFFGESDRSRLSRYRTYREWYSIRVVRNSYPKARHTRRAIEIIDFCS